MRIDRQIEYTDTQTDLAKVNIYVFFRFYILRQETIVVKWLKFYFILQSRLPNNFVNQYYANTEVFWDVIFYLMFKTIKVLNRISVTKLISIKNYTLNPKYIFLYYFTFLRNFPKIYEL